MAYLIITQNKTIRQIGNEIFEATIWLGIGPFLEHDVSEENKFFKILD